MPIIFEILFKLIFLWFAVKIDPFCPDFNLPWIPNAPNLKFRCFINTKYFGIVIILVFIEYNPYRMNFASHKTLSINFLFFYLSGIFAPRISLYPLLKELFNCYNLNRQSCYWESQILKRKKKFDQDHTKYFPIFCLNLVSKMFFWLL